MAKINNKIFLIYIKRDVYTISSDKEIVLYKENQDVYLSKRWDKTGYLRDGREVKLSERTDRWVFIPHEFRKKK